MAAKVIVKPIVQGLSLKALYQNTPKLQQNGAKDVVVSDMVSSLHKDSKTKQFLPEIEANTTSMSSRTQQIYTTTVIGKQSGIPLHKQKAVKVQCSCANYMFMWEYSNWHHKAADVVYGNGDPPIVTNPHLSFGMCKHLVALTREIFRRKL